MATRCSSPFAKGYYLTPENYPGNEPAIEEGTEGPTETPVSTIHVVETETPTPLPTATPPPTATLTPSPTMTPFSCTDTEGMIITDSFFSSITGEEFHYHVYLPPCYAISARRFPYLIMMHGLGEGMMDNQWERIGLLDEADEGYVNGDIAPMVIVMPNGVDADHGGIFGPSLFPEVVMNELIPIIEQQYCVRGVAAQRAIGGLSRGGYWAYWIAFTNPEMFSKVGGHSAYFYEAEYSDEKNPNNIVDTAPGIEHLSMYLDHGPDDYPQVLVGVQDFVDRLNARGIDVAYVLMPDGGHTEEYWGDYSADYLEFYSAGWTYNINQLPSCYEANPDGDDS